MSSDLTLSLGFSPCPNDTFIFDAIVNNKIEKSGINFNFIVEDIEKLNRKALKGELDVTKLSFHSWLYAHSEYILLDAGGAFGKNYGPLLVSKNSLNIEDNLNYKIAIPGEYTTANLLLKIFFPQIRNKQEMLFSEISDAVVNNKVDAGLIIHEDRFIYEQKKLIKILDLGEMWGAKYNLPLPLGGIFVKRSLPKKLILELNKLIHDSIIYGLSCKGDYMDFVKKYSSSLSEKTINSHINLYVNEYTLSLNDECKKAVNLLCEKAIQLGFIIDNNLNNIIL